MVVVKPARKDDSKEIFTWRNDKVTRQMSVTTEAIKWKEHKIWFENIIKDENYLILICMRENTNEKISVVRFDINNKRALVSINMSPNIRGRRLAKNCLTESIKYLIKYKSTVKFLDADIKAENYASISTFEGIGFLLVSQEKDFLHFEYRF